MKNYKFVIEFTFSDMVLIPHCSMERLSNRLFGHDTEIFVVGIQ